MRKIMVLVVVAVMACAGYAAAQTSVANPLSRHNLGSLNTTTAGKSTNTDQVCVFCHTPHQPTAVTTTPLWNHDMNSTYGPYGVYSSPTFNSGSFTSDISDIVGGTAVSNLCMSCHDGTVAVNALYNPPGVGAVNPTMTQGDDLTATYTINSTRTTNLGGLTNDHPVNMTYDNVVYPGLRAPTGSVVTFGGNTVSLYTGMVQCASCHNPHDSQVGS